MRLVLLSGLSLTLVMPVHAQQTGPEALRPASAPTSQDDAGDIVVTAQRREQKINDIGVSITALSSTALIDRGITDVAGLSRAVPGFTFTQSDVNVPVFTLRGVGFNETSLAASPAVSVYVDEVALPYPAMTAGPQFDLERVEVVKGPQGTLYGQNSTGGAVNYIAKRPTDSSEAGIYFDYGRFNRINSEGYVSGPLAPNVGIRVSARGETGGGWQHSLTREDKLGKIRRLGGRMLLDWNASDGVRFQLNLNGWKDTGETQAPQLIAVALQTPARAVPEVVASPIAPRDPQLADWDPGRRFARDVRFYQASIRGDVDLGDFATLTSITAYSDLKTDSVNERDGMASQNSFYRAFGYARSVSQELRLAGEVGDLAQWIVGANYGRDRIFDQQNISVATSSNVQNVFGIYAPDTNNYARTKVATYAAFGSVDWRLTDTLKLTTGARYTEAKRDFVGCTFDIGDGRTARRSAAISAFFRNGVGLAPLPAGTFRAGDCAVLTSDTFEPVLVKDSLNENNVSWRAALEWKAMPQMLLYASVSQGYKAGNFPTLSAALDVQYQPVVQEKLLAYEGGIKAGLLDRKLQANLSVFYYDYTNKQLKGRIRDAIFGSLQALVNIPKSDVRGAEVELVANPIRELTLTANYAYVDSKIKRYSGFTPFNVLSDFSGSAFNFSPKHNFNAGVDLRLPLEDSLELLLGGSFSYRSATTAAIGTGGLFAIDSYALGDLRAGVAAGDGQWRATVFVNNVTNKYYWTNTFRGNDSIARYVGMPRTYGLTLVYRYR